jgi:hypothetical protein
MTTTESEFAGGKVSPGRSSHWLRSVIRLVALISGFQMLSACGDDDAGDFCHRLGASSDCGGTGESTCRQAISAQLSSTPQCETALTQLLACAAKLSRVGCSGNSSAYAIGDGTIVNNNFVTVGGANLVVEDSSCTSLKQAYDACSG